jgi:multiple antibiotic resistance protein
VAVDAIGVLPLYLGLIEDIEPKLVRRILQQSVITALGVALAFLGVGVGALRLLGITIADFMVAGGLLLLILSIRDIVTTDSGHRHVDPESLGAVPLGVPLITGPAVLTTSILLLNQHGLLPTALALILNILIAGIVFGFAQHIYRFLGKAGAKTVSKIASLLLAAIAVMIIRRGIMLFISH